MHMQVCRNTNATTEHAAKKEGHNAPYTCLFHALILGIYPCLAAFELNRHEIFAIEFMRCFPYALIISILVILLISLSLRSLLKGTTLFTASCILLFAYGPFAKCLRADVNTPGSGLVELQFKPSELIPFTILVLSFLLLLFLIRRASDAKLSTLAFFLNVFAATLVGISGFTILTGKLRESLIHYPPFEFSSYSFKAAPESPDVYYIVLDGYGRSDILKELYGYDNTPFIAELKRLGFFVAEDAVSNYHRTNFLLAAALNSSYLEAPFLDPKYAYPVDVFLQNRIQDNALGRILRNAGYKTVAFESGYRTTELKGSDEYRSLTNQNRVASTALSYIQFPFFRESISQILHEEHRQRLRRAFPAVLESSIAIKGPKFVFLHLIAPHPPFVFHADGSAYNSNKVFNLGDGDDYGGLQDYKERYAEQVAYMSHAVIAFLRELLDVNNKPVVVLHADHGPGSAFDRESLDHTNIKERFSILNAYYSPQGDYSGLYPAISPVNMVRVLLSKISKLQIPLLEDRSFFSRMQKPLEFARVHPENPDPP